MCAPTTRTVSARIADQAALGVAYISRMAATQLRNSLCLRSTVQCELFAPVDTKFVSATDPGGVD